jgi:hypothetical protein
MKLSKLSRYALGICVAVAMLAGCGGSQPPIGGGVPQARRVHAKYRDRP